MASAAAALVTVTTLVVRAGLDPRWIRGADTAASMGVTGTDAVAYRVLCLALATLCGACVLAVVPSRLRHVEGLGRRSLAVYALHIPVVFVLQDAFQGAGVGQVEASLLALAVTVVVLRVLVHPFFDRAIRRTASTMAQVAVPPPLLHHAGERPPSGSGREQDLADVARLLEHLVRLAYVFQRVGRVDDRSHRAVGDQRPDLARPWP